MTEDRTPPRVMPVFLELALEYLYLTIKSMRKSKKQPNVANELPKDPPGYDRFVDSDLRFMTIMPASDQNEWNGSWKIKRSKESAGEWYGIVEVTFDDGETKEYKTQPSSYEKIPGHIATLIQTICSHEQARK